MKCEVRKHELTDEEKMELVHRTWQFLHDEYGTYVGEDTTTLVDWHGGMKRCTECGNITKIDYNFCGSINFCLCCGKKVVSDK